MSDEVAWAAAARCSFQLTYARSDEIRRFEPGWLTGPSIDNAYGEGGVPQAGEWYASSDVMPDTEDGCVDVYASYAVNEAIHEALEWFRVDEVPWLDPHGKAEQFINVLVDEFCAKLAKLRQER